MSLIALKCPSCGGNLEFEDSREFGFCQYCGTKIMISQEINNTVNNTVNNFNSTTIISNGKEEQNRRKISAAQKAADEGNYEAAKTIADDILLNDSTFAEAYLVLLKCAALRDFREYGYILKVSESTVRSYYSQYHLYSNDARSFKEVLNDIGVSYTKETVAIRIQGGALTTVQNGIGIINDIMAHPKSTSEERELLKDLIESFIRCPGLLMGLPQGLFDTPHFYNFEYTSNGRSVTSFNQFSEVRLTYLDYQNFRQKMGENEILNSDTLEKYLGSLKQTVSEPVTTWTLFSKKKDRNGNAIDVSKTESRLRKMVDTYPSYGAEVNQLKSRLEKTDYYTSLSIPNSKPPLYLE